MDKELLNISQNLETERLMLRKYKKGDGAVFYNLIDKNNDRMLDSFPIILSNAYDRISAEYFIKTRIDEWDEKASYNFGIWLKQFDEYIGHISLKNIDWIIPRGEIAYFISYEYEGKGIMKEALTAIVKFAFEELLFNRLYLRIMTNNERSFKLAEKCGFIKEGLLRKDHKTYSGELVDLYYYGVTREDYDKL